MAAVDAAVEVLIALTTRAGEHVRPRVSTAQLRVLRIVAAHETINLTTLATALDAMPSSASRLCDRLQAAGLLDRRSASGDRREVELTLSPDGARLMSRLRDIRLADLGAVLSAMTGSGRAALLRGLEEFAAAARKQDRIAAEDQASGTRSDRRSDDRSA